MKILIIEDEAEIQRSIIEYLTGQGYDCESALNFMEGIAKVVAHQYECIILDLTLPKGNGLKILEKIKEIESKAGVIILSAKNSLEDKIQGLKLGADDYLSKPFHVSELGARIQAIIRRKTSSKLNFIQFNEIILNFDERKVYVHDRWLDLTDKEFKVLEYFLINQGRVLNKAEIAEYCWGDDFDQVDNYDFIYTHIKNVRKKLIGHKSKDYIKTVYGVGYRFFDY